MRVQAVKTRRGRGRRDGPQPFRRRPLSPADGTVGGRRHVESRVAVRGPRRGAGTTTKADLVTVEAERYVATSGAHGAQFTIAHGRLVPSAGIDESNGGGDYVLWPADPQASANRLRAHLRRRHGVRHVGVAVTDSTCTPLRRGTVGTCLSHSGFVAVNDYVGKPDFFGRPFRRSQANVAAGLAAAVVAMGEEAEQTPLCVIDAVPFVRFQARNPTAGELGHLRIPFEGDLFAPFLGSVPWPVGGAGPPDVGEVEQPTGRGVTP
jgi:dihydrofolate synthase / folylpolyglutamate synthase